MHNYIQSKKLRMFRITKSDCEYAINNASKVNYQTIKIWKCYLNKINEDFIFSSQDELEQQLLNINKTYSSAYNMSSLLRATCKINNLDIKLKEIVSNLYKDLRYKSANEQLNNRMNKKQWTLEELITIMRNIKMVDYNSIMIKLLMAMYTINPPLRNDYYNVIIVTDYYSNVDDTNNYIDLNKKILNIYSNKSKKFKQTVLSDELIDIINESLIIFPRKLLFTKKNGENFSSPASLSVCLLNLLKSFIKDKDFSFNTFRHVYAQWSLKQDTNTRIKAADDMMHTKLTHFLY